MEALPSITVSSGSPGGEPTPGTGSLMGNTKNSLSLDVSELDSKLSAATGGRRLDLKALIKTSWLEETLFKLAYITSQDNELSPIFTWILLFLEDLQWLSFSYSTILHNDLPGWFPIIFDPVRAIATYPTFAIVNILTLSLVFAMVSLVGGVIYIMQRQPKVPARALKVLRLLSALVTTALSIPIARILALGVHCIDGVLPMLNVQCYASPHLPLYIFNILGLVTFVPLVVVGIVLFIEMSPKSQSPVARAHGRVDVHNIVARLVLVFLDIAAHKSSEMYQWIFMSITAVWLAFLSFKMGCTQPYYSPLTTALRSGMAMAASTSTVATMIIRGLAGLHNVGYWVYVIPASILGFILGLVFSYVYSRYFLKRTVRKWHQIIREEQASAKDKSYANLKLSGYLPANNLVVQEQLQDPVVLGAKVPIAASKRSALKTSTSPARPKTTGVSIFSDLIIPGNESSGPNNAMPVSPLHVSNSENSDSDTPDAPGPVAHRNIDSMARHARSIKSSAQITDSPDDEVSAAFSGLKRSPSTRFGISNAKAVLPPAEDSELIVTGLAHGTSGEVFDIVTEEDMPQRRCVFDSPLDVEVCVRFIRKNPSVKKITIGLQLLERGLLEFPNDPLLLLLASTYLTVYYGETGARVADRLMKLLGTSKNPVPVDVKYLVFCREQAAIDSGVGVSDRSDTYALEREARQFHLRALRAMRDVWEAVRSQSTKSHLAQTVSNLALYRWSASAAYEKLLARNHKDKNILRQYAMFLTSVEGDLVRAHQIIEHAAEVETYDMYQRGMNQAKGTKHDPGNTRLDAHLLPPFAHPSLFHGSEMDISRSVHELAVFDGTPKSGAPRSMNARAPSAHGSQASGSSTTRAIKQKAVLRIQLYQRLTQPLMGATAVTVLAVMFVGALIAGFAVCLNLLHKTTSLLQVELYASRRSRAALQLILEGIREMVYANEIRNRIKFNHAYSLVHSNLDYLLSVGLPVINLFAKSSLTNVEEFRFFYTTHSTNAKLDFYPVLKTSVQFANVMAQTAALALGYETYGNLTATAFVQVPELRVLTDNIFAVQYALKGLITTAVDYYNMLAGQTTVQLLVIMGLALVLLGTLALLIDRQIVRKYFLREGKVHGLLFSIKKKCAAQLVTDLEEDIENYSELLSGDGEEDTELDMGDNGLAGVSGGDDPSGNTSAVPKTGTDTQKRQLYYYVSLYAFVVVVAAIIVVIFTMTLTSLNVQGDLDRMVDSLDRRYYSNSIRMIAREYISPDHTLPILTVLQNFRSSVHSAELVHQKLLEDPDGLDALMPDMTALPRNCSKPADCDNLVEIPEIGFTRRLSEVPLNVEYSRMLDIAGRLCDSYSNTDPQGYKEWLLLKALTHDVGERISHVDERYAAILKTRAQDMGQWIIVTFVLLIVASLVACIAFIAIGVRRLTRDALVLITLLYTLPPTMVKELPEVMAFLDTGGLTLMNT